MKKLLILSLLITSAHASVLDRIACHDKIVELTKEWKASGDWIKQSQGGLESFFYASPTSKVGEWVLVREIPNGAVASKTDQQGRIEAAFLGKECSKDVKTYTHDAPVPGAKTDAFIDSFVKDKKKGAIYVWSPRMGLSKKGIPEIKKAAQNLKLPLLILLDKDVPDSEYKKLEKELGNDVVQKVDSLEFRMRNIGQHYPAVIVFKDSKVLSGVKYGFEKSDRYQSDLANMLSTGK